MKIVYTVVVFLGMSIILGAVDAKSFKKEDWFGILIASIIWPVCLYDAIISSVKYISRKYVGKIRWQFAFIFVWVAGIALACLIWSEVSVAWYAIAVTVFLYVLENFISFVIDRIQESREAIKSL